MINKPSNRIWEIDFFRGLAIILMILFHLVVDLKDFYSYPLEYLAGFWYIEGKFSAILFIILCGISSTLSNNSTHHGIVICMWSIALTTVTYLYNPDFYIHFGILHFLGISLLSASQARQLPTIRALLLSFISILVGLVFDERFISSPYLFPLGLQTNTFSSLDYYPLFPWYGIFLMGIIAGKKLYPTKKSLLSFDSLSSITWLGHHSLAIYLIHQPILLACLHLLLGT
jgi:uncharacterized membrane protein